MNLPSGYFPSRSPFLWNPVGVRNFFLFLPSVRYATLGFGVQRRWRNSQLPVRDLGALRQCQFHHSITPFLSITIMITITINFSTFYLLPSSFFLFFPLCGGLFQGRHTSPHASEISRRTGFRSGSGFGGGSGYPWDRRDEQIKNVFQRTPVRPCIPSGCVGVDTFGPKHRIL